MTTRAQLAQLLVVQRRRVDQAMAQVRAKNEVLHQRQVQRNNAFDRWTGADEASRLQRESQVQVVSDHLGRGIGAVNLTAQAQRREWLRARVEECWQLLANAESALTQARDEATQAQTVYRQACNRHEALVTFASKLKTAENQKQARSEEGAVEDLVTNRYANGR